MYHSKWSIKSVTELKNRAKLQTDQKQCSMHEENKLFRHCIVSTTVVKAAQRPDGSWTVGGLGDERYQSALENRERVYRPCPICCVWLLPIGFRGATLEDGELLQGCDPHPTEVKSSTTVYPEFSHDEKAPYCFETLLPALESLSFQFYLHHRAIAAALSNRLDRLMATKRPAVTSTFVLVFGFDRAHRENISLQSLFRPLR